MNVRHPFVWLSESGQKRAFLGIFVFTLATMMCMNIISHPLVNETAPQGIVSFEFAGTFEIAQRMMASWGEKGLISAGLSLGFDYLFLVVYAICIGLGCVLVARAGTPLRRPQIFDCNPRASLYHLWTHSDFFD